MDEYIDKWSVINRLIDLENEFQQYKPFHGFEHAMYRKICETEIAIGKMPATDVAPVRHGRWDRVIPSKSAAKWSSKVSCSVCHNAGYNRFNYCPNCGAKMDEEARK